MIATWFCPKEVYVISKKTCNTHCRFGALARGFTSKIHMLPSSRSLKLKLQMPPHKSKMHLQVHIELAHTWLSEWNKLSACVEKTFNNIATWAKASGWALLCTRNYVSLTQPSTEADQKLFHNLSVLFLTKLLPVDWNGLNQTMPVQYEVFNNKEQRNIL